MFTAGVCVKAVRVMRISDYLVMLVLCPCTGLSTHGRFTKGSRTRSVTRAGASPSKRLAAGRQARSLRSRPPQAPGKRERGSQKRYQRICLLVPVPNRHAPSGPVPVGACPHRCMCLITPVPDRHAPSGPVPVGAHHNLCMLSDECTIKCVCCSD